MTNAYITDGAILCDSCALDVINMDLRKALPDYVVRWVDRNGNSAAHALSMLCAIGARHYRREQSTAPHRTWAYIRTAVEELEEGFDDADVRAETAAAVLGRDGWGHCDIAQLGYGWDGDAVDGEFCECGEELSEPMSISDVVSDTWPIWAQEVWAQIPRGVEDLFFWDVAEATGDCSRRSFYDEYRRGGMSSVVDEAIGKVIAEYATRAHKAHTGMEAS